MRTRNRFVMYGYPRVLWTYSDLPFTAGDKSLAIRLHINANAGYLSVQKGLSTTTERQCRKARTRRAAPRSACPLSQAAFPDARSSARCCLGRGAFDRLEEMAMIRRENLEKLASLLILKAGQALTWARAKIKLGTTSLQWLPWIVSKLRKMTGASSGKSDKTPQ
jgi:hypothetical protein